MKKFLAICLGAIIMVSGCQQSLLLEAEQVLPQPEEQAIPETGDVRLSLIAVGDIMLARGVGTRISKNSVDYPFEHVRDIISGADLAFGNLETTLATTGTKLPGKQIWFRAVPEAAQGLKRAGFDVVSLANNHILDYDTPALMETIHTLENRGIGFVGAGENLSRARQPLIVIKDGLRLGFLAYNEFYNYYWSTAYKRTFEATDQIAGTAPMKGEIIEEDIKKLRGLCDILVVSLHWGIEESNSVTGKQRELAHNIIKWGADLVLGHHPHVLQGIEFYNGKLIAYSLGNFVFDQNDENNKQSMILEITFKNSNIEKVSALPVYIINKCQPVVPPGPKSKLIINKIIQLSRDLGADGREINGKVVFVR